ncbi:hypothetical protein ACQI4L_10365 [Mycolicibacterium litorale]|uniref:hypothetical protein n=1 Tax=Mycolicibacterium litorale TaxID=758802 RepID=UPI003CF55188
MDDADRTRSCVQKRSFRYGVAAIALCAAIAGAPAHAVAWADDTVSDSTSSATTNAGPAAGNPADPDKPIAGDEPGREDPQAAEPSDGVTDESDDTGVPDSETDLHPDGSDTEPDASPDTTAPPEEEGEDAPERVPPTDPAPDIPVASEPVVTESDSREVAESVRDELAGSRPVTKAAHADDGEDGVAVATLTPPAELVVVTVPSTQPAPTHPHAAAETGSTAAAPAAVVSPAVDQPTPAPPQPLSPIAELLELPGRLVNAVLEVFDFTASANSPSLPVGFQPINDAIFGAFRELERQLGLWRTPVPQPDVPTLTYTGPTTRPTPTVAQFLNASAAGYVLGSTPGGLVPFTVDGFQMSDTDVFSGMVGRVWATPEGQLIIAYQGTTGGSHLLFNPLITVAQVLADLQVVFTGTTPLAFYDALDFAERVQAEAALQGYTSDDIFVTGHSLGGWEAQFVAQQTGLAGIGFEAPGINTVVPGNGADSMFVNIGTYGSSAPYMATDLPGLQPFMPPYVPGGGTKPHYGPIVMIGDPAAMTPLYNASALWGTSPIGSAVFLVDYLMNFFQYHLPGVQAYHLDVTPDPGIVLWLGTARGPVHTGYGTLTIPQLMKAASDDGILFRP